MLTRSPPSHPVSRSASAWSEARAAAGVRRVIYTNVKEYLPGSQRTLFTLLRQGKEGHRVPATIAAHALWLQRFLETGSEGRLPALAPAVGPLIGGSLVEFAKRLIKIAIVGAAAWYVIADQVKDISRFIDMDPNQLGPIMGDMTVAIMIAVIAVMTAIAGPRSTVTCAG